MTHTPVPWSCREIDQRLSIIGSGIAGTLMQFSRANTKHPRAWEDARFIVVACNAHEELLAALEDAIDQLEACGQGSCAQTAEACRDVIAKATGEET